MSTVLLKARPTESQLADRLVAPVPDGIELYLDRLDLIGDRWLETIASRIRSLRLPPSFIWIVEAPIRTLGEQFFDLTNDDADHRETIARVMAVGAAIGAVAANIHVVCPTLDAAELSQPERRAALSAAEPLLRYYVSDCQEFGMTPQIENVPPVGRMRESAYVFSPIGATPADLLTLAEAFPSLRFTADVSHAALYLNWRSAARSRLTQRFHRVVDFYSGPGGPGSLTEFLGELGDRITAVHVSNADGLFGEGLGYSDGPEDLDCALGPFLMTDCYLVTETLERDPVHATGMRDVQSHLLELRRAVLTGKA